MTVKELRDHLDYMMSKNSRIAGMSVEIWDPYSEDAYNWNGTHNTHHLNGSRIRVEGFYDGETWDESSSSYDYLEITCSDV